MKWRSTALAAVLVVASALPAMAAEVLITEQEAKLPVAPGAAPVASRGITRGPKVLLVSPSDVGAGQKSPIDLKVKFQAHGGATIDTDSVKVTYLKNPLVDLTKRVSEHIEDEGINFKSARIPPGDHLIRVDIKDSDGRTGTGIFALKVLK